MWWANEHTLGLGFSEARSSSRQHRKSNESNLAPQLRSPIMLEIFFRIKFARISLGGFFFHLKGQTNVAPIFWRALKMWQFYLFWVNELWLLCSSYSLWLEIKWWPLWTKQCPQQVFQERASLPTPVEKFPSSNVTHSLQKFTKIV